jgi:LPXTG-motif cell wall-anchored protein
LALTPTGLGGLTIAGSSATPAPRTCMAAGTGPGQSGSSTGGTGALPATGSASGLPLTVLAGVLMLVGAALVARRRALARA